MANRPGVMFYFDVRPCIKRLSLEEKGELFEALLDYAEFGLVPDLGGMAAVAWDFIRPRVDRDGERYENVVSQRQYAVYVREAKKRNETPLTFEEWKEARMTGLELSLSTDNESYPTTTSTTTPTTTTTSTPTSNGKGDARGETQDLETKKRTALSLFYETYPEARR